MSFVGTVEKIQSPEFDPLILITNCSFFFFFVFFFVFCLFFINPCMMYVLFCYFYFLVPFKIMKKRRKQ